MMQKENLMLNNDFFKQHYASPYLFLYLFCHLKHLVKPKDIRNKESENDQGFMFSNALVFFALRPRKAQKNLKSSNF